MKKLIFILFVLCLIGCRNGFTGSGVITDKGVDYIDVKAVFDNFEIKDVDRKDNNIIDMYWIRINGYKEKIYINLFTYETMDKGSFIILGPEHADERFETEY